MKAKPFFENKIYRAIHIAHHHSLFSPHHFHRHLELAVVTSGKLEIEIDNDSRLLGVGDAVFISPYVIHSYKLHGNSTRCIVTCEPEVLGMLGEFLVENKPVCPFIPKEKCSGILNGLMEVQTESGSTLDMDAADITERFVEICSIISKLLELTGIQKNKVPANATYLRAMELVNSRYADDKLSIDEVAKEVNMSVSALYKLFSKNMGVGFKKYLTSLRCGNAENLLRTSDKSITEITMMTGFGSIRTFNRTFKSVTGLSPSEYRDKNKFCISPQNDDNYKDIAWIRSSTRRLTRT